MEQQHQSAREHDEDIFRDLTAEQRQRLEQRTHYADYEPGYLFFAPDEQGDRLMIVQRGQVRLYKLSPEGRALTLFVLEPNAFFGEMALVERPHDCFAEALTECTVGMLSRDDVRRVLAHNATFALRVVDVMSQRLRALEQKLADIAFRSVPQRLAALLLELANDTADRAADADPPAIMRYTHHHLAEMIGAYRETVTKAIGEFREAGMIRIEDEVIYLTDVAQLRRVAG